MGGPGLTKFFGGALQEASPLREINVQAIMILKGLNRRVKRALKILLSKINLLILINE